MKITTKTQAIARYNELYEYHMEALASHDQSEMNKIPKWEREMAELEREFPGTLEAWTNQD